MRIIETKIKPKYRRGQEVRVDAGICKITHIYYRTRHPWITEIVNENPEITYLCEFTENINHLMYSLDSPMIGGFSDSEMMCTISTKIFSVEYRESDILEVVDVGFLNDIFPKFSEKQAETYQRTLLKLEESGCL